MKRFKALCKNLALSSISLLLCFVLAEVTLKIAGYGKLEVYDSDPFIYWRLKPNQDCFTKVAHRPVHVNSQRTRGPEFSVPKPAGVIRILSLGDSTTFGWGLSDEETYSHQLEKKLNERNQGRRFEVINAGCNAWSYPQLKSFFNHYGVEFQPDYILVGGGNFWTDFVEEGSPEFKKAMGRRVLLKNLVRRSALYHFLFERSMSGLYNKVRTRFIPVDPTRDKIYTGGAADPAAFIDKHLRELIRAAQTNHVSTVLLNVPPNRREYTNDFSEQVLLVRRKAAQELKVPIADLAMGDWPPPEKSFYLEGDHVHLNAAGNQDVAEKLAGVFSGLVRK
jgi:lysophospholipase L1-like esterase